LVIETSTLIPFLFSVLIGGLVGSRYGALYANQKTVQYLLVCVLLLASGKRIFEVVI